MPREARPRFELSTDETADVLLGRIGSRLRTRDCPLGGYAAENRVLVYVPSARQRLWSAELRVDVVRKGPTTVLEGRYAPHPHVWITYVILLAAVAVGLLVAVVLALVQWSMNERPSALYALAPLLLLGAGTYATAFIGQKFATDEMDELRGFLEDSLEPDSASPSHVRNTRPTSTSARPRSAGT
jgi:hypothetical protein